MKTKILKRKSIIGVLTLLMSLTLSLAFIFGQTPASTAYAARGSDDQWVTVEEIYDDKTQSFDSAKLMDLIEKLIGQRSYDALKTAVGITEPPKGTQTSKTSKTSANFRAVNEGKNVSVYFGGMKWDAVYLTAAKTTEGNTTAGDIILDLWRSADELTSPSNKSYKASSDEAPYLLNWSYNSTGYGYPSNMYSTSNIRVEILNAGGQYSTSGSALKACEQNANHQYARFTMSTEQGVENSLTEYIAKPSEVGYQEIEYDSETMQSFYGPKESEGYPTEVKYYYFPNDAYGTPNGSADSAGWDTQEKDGMDMSVYGNKGDSETAYDAWKDDYLWLPSLTETGMSNGNVSSIGDGIWDTDASLRSAKSGVGNGSCWLRSGAYWCANRAYLLDTSGNYSLLVVNNLGRGVRPALHLNLTAAMRSATPDKDRWKGDTKPYSPDGVTWKFENTDVVEITPVGGEGGGDTSWYDSAKHTITAKKVGKYQIRVKPSTDFHWKDGTDNEIIVTYTVVPADMTVTFNNGRSGPFNNERLEQKREFVYSLGMEPIALKLPDPTDKKFPINWKGVTWYPGTISKLEIQYIVQKYEETAYNEDTIKGNLDELKSSGNWKDYEGLTDKIAQEPMFYVVYFKAVDTEGNHNTCYDYFVVHIVAEKLNITLSEAAKAGFEKGVEYGDVAHTKGAFEKDILSGIQKVMGQLDRDKTRDFKDNIDSFIFYLRKDNTVADDDIYTVEEDGIHLQNGSQSEKVDNLPLGTYHLYVDAADKNTSKYLTFAWADGNPSFEVKARKINVTLTFGKGATYGEPHTNWVTVNSATRATVGATGTWYAQNEAKGDDDLDILKLSYTLEGTDAPSVTTPADTYTVVPTCSNPNYDVEFADAQGGTELKYTIAKAPLTVTAKNKAITYGDEPSDDGVEYNGFVNGESESDLSGVLTFDYGGYAAFKDIGEYVITPSGLSSGNYDIKFENGTLTVGQKMIEAKWSDKRYTYTGSAFTDLPTATAEGIGNDGTFTLLVALSGSAQTFMNAGGYVFKAAFDNTDDKTKNYTLNESTETRAYIIEKQSVTAPTIASKVYNGKTQKADVDDSALYRVSENNGGIGADDYEVKLALQHPENYKWATSDEAEIILIFTITKANYDMSGVTFADQTITWDNSAHKLEVRNLPVGVSVTYSGGNGYSTDGATEPGVYTVTAIFTVDENYEVPKSMRAVLTITRATYNMKGITFEDASFPYDGKPHSLAIGGKLPGDVSVEYAGNERTNAGVYKVMAIFTGDAEHYEPIAPMQATLTITKQQVTKPSEDKTAFVYTGTEQTYAVAENSAYTVIGNRQTNANEAGYEVKVVLSDKANYEWADGKTDDLIFLFRIAQATVFATWAERSYTYTGSELPMPAATVHGLGEDGELVLDVALKTPSGGAFKNAGNYTFTATLKAGNAKNYILTETEKTYTVAKATVNKPSEDSTTFVYTGTEQTYAVAENHAYTVTGNRQTNANENGYTVTVALEDKNNYEWADGKTDDLIFLFKIAQATVSATWAERSYAYTGSALPMPAATVHGLGEDGELVLDVALKTPSGGAFKNAGTYTFIATLKAGNAKNYILTETEKTYTVAKANYDLSGVRFSDKTVEYDGEEHSIAIEGELPEGVLAKYEGNGKTDVGDYPVAVSFTGDMENYNPIPSMHATLSIRYAGYDFSGITFENETVIYDGNVHGVYIQGDLPEGVRVAYEGNEKTDPGIYAVKAIFSNALGKVSERTAVLTVLRTHAQIVDANGDPIVVVDSADGFGPTWELVLETSDDIMRTVWAWGKDNFSEKYVVKFIKDGVEVPFDGKATVRLLIPEEVRGEAFTLRSLGRAAKVEYTRDGNYVVFEVNGLTTYEFTCSSVPYLPIVMIAAGVLLVSAAVLVIWRIAIKKKKEGE